MKKAKKKLYFLTGHTTWKDDEGKVFQSIDHYVGNINPLDSEKYFEGAWFDENNLCAGTVVLSKETYKQEIISCKELV